MKLNPIGPNQNEITFANGVRLLFSYKTPVAAFIDGKSYRTDTKWSNTTSRHINRWLAGSNAATLPQSRFDNLAHATGWFKPQTPTL